MEGLMWFFAGMAVSMIISIINKPDKCKNCPDTEEEGC